MYFKQLTVSVRGLVVLSVLTGGIYPLVLTGMARALFPWQAGGSLICEDAKPLGSRWIGQPFSDPSYFWGRPSATAPVAYNGASSSGSNLGPLNPTLLQRVKERVEALRSADPDQREPVPVDLVTASGSGVDPHITPAAARYQLKRVARLRGLPESVVERLVESNTDGRWGGVFGEARVHVLELNMALDRLTEGHHQRSVSPNVPDSVDGKMGSTQSVGIK